MINTDLCMTVCPASLLTGWPHLGGAGQDSAELLSGACWSCVMYCDLLLALRLLYSDRDRDPARAQGIRKASALVPKAHLTDRAEEIVTVVSVLAA